MLSNKDLRLVVQGMADSCIHHDLNQDERRGVFIVVSALNETLKDRLKGYNGYAIKEIANKCKVKLKG